MVMQSIFLAIAGFLSVYSWHYALKKDLVSDAPTKKEKEDMYIKLLPEPVVSVLTIPLAFFGPGIWTLGWLLLIPAGWIVKKMTPRIKIKE